MTNSAIIEVDTHGLTAEEAVRRTEHALIRAKSTVYRIRVIHGYNRGTRTRDSIIRKFSSDPRILRIERSVNPGVTELVLKEY